MERFIWKTIVRFKSLHFDSFAKSTHGQLTWIFLNNLVDYDEERGKVHLKCLDRYDKEVCPVCQEPIGSTEVRVTEEFMKEFGDKIYRPGETVIYTPEEASAKRRELLEVLKEHNQDRDGPIQGLTVFGSED